MVYMLQVATNLLPMQNASAEQRKSCSVNFFIKERGVCDLRRLEMTENSMLATGNRVGLRGGGGKQYIANPLLENDRRDICCFGNIFEIYIFFEIVVYILIF